MALPGKGQAPSGYTKSLLVIDGDCGFCQTSAKYVAQKFPGDWVVVASQTLELEPLKLSQSDVERASWWVESHHGEMRTYSGAQAFGALLLNHGGVSAAIGALAFIPPFSWVAHGLYILIAKNRGRLPGATDACQLPPRA